MTAPVESGRQKSSPPPFFVRGIFSLDVISGRLRVVDQWGKKVPGQHYVQVLQDPVQARNKRCRAEVRLYCSLETGHDVWYYSPEKNMLFDCENNYVNVPTEWIHDHAEKGFTWVSAVFECSTG